MYIPFAFFGGNICTGSGFCFTYGNTSITTNDNISYTSLCGGATKNLTINSNSVEKFAAVSASVSGLAAETKLSGQPYTISSSCNIIQPHSYTLNFNGVGSDFYYYQASVNSNPGNIQISFSGSGNTSLVSVFPPQLTTKLAAANTTIVGSIATGSAVFNTNWNNGIVRKWSIDMMSGSFSINTSLYNKPIIRNVVIPFELDNNPGLRYEMLSETTPYIQFNTPISNTAFRGLNYSPVPGGIQNISSSCWNYFINNINISPSTTVNYLDCNNVSASVVVANGLNQTVCAKYNSIIFPSLSAGRNLEIQLVSPC